MPEEIKVLDKGFVRLDDSMADDLSVVNSARVSLHKHHEVFEVDIDDNLIRFLMRERHGTPFEHNSFRFHIKVPIFVVREWQRHRIASYNEWSGRYAVLEPDFYIPDYIRTQVGKPGAYHFEAVSRFKRWWFRRQIEKASIKSYKKYQRALKKGIAKEQARLHLTPNVYTEMYWTINARSLMNFLSLRNADQAMFEIKQYAEAVEQIFAEKMPITHQAFLDNGRIAP